MNIDDAGSERNPGGRREGYAELRSYAVIGNGRTMALIAADGQVDWYPVPDLDSTPVFASLLDADHGGSIGLQPVGAYTMTRAYISNTNVLETVYTTTTGRVRVMDSLNLGTIGSLPWGEFARRIDGVEGEVEMTWHVRPGTRLNTGSPWVDARAGTPVLRIDDVSLAVVGMHHAPQETADATVAGTFRTAPGSHHLLAVVSSAGEPLRLPTPQLILQNLEHSIDHWQRWARQLTYEGPWRDEVVRSALTLKLLSHTPSGAILAAATTSLPEAEDGSKNWDYRCFWLRDATYSLHNLIRTGTFEDVHANVSWLLRSARRAGGQQLPVLMGTDGDRPQELATYDVPGWRSIGPVVRGNHAAEQLQLGVYGDLMDIARLYTDAGNVLDVATSRMLANVADEVCDLWRRKDAGMWELDTPRHYSSSKMGCWHALACAIHLAENHRIPGNIPRWTNERDAIRAWIETHCWSERRQSYTWYPETDELDASVLLHALSGFDRGDRMRSTVEALRKELGRGALLYRFSGAERVEKTFTACGFWMAAALACVGEEEEARATMRQLVASANDVGIYAEMIDERDQSFWGNLPQALSHLALMTAALTIGDLY